MSDFVASDVELSVFTFSSTAGLEVSCLVLVVSTEVSVLVWVFVVVVDVVVVVVAPLSLVLLLSTLSWTASEAGLFVVAAGTEFFYKAFGENIDEFGPRFPDMTYTYDRRLLNELKKRK